MSQITEHTLTRRGLLQRLRATNYRFVLHPSAGDDFCIRSEFGLQRLPAPYWISVLLCGGFALFAQVVEFTLRGATLEDILVQGRLLKVVAVPLVFLYMLVALPMLKNYTVEALTRLRPVIRISDQEFNTFLRRMVCVDLRLDLILLVTSAVVVSLLLAVLRLPTPMGGGVTYLPPDWWRAGTILLGYTLFGWLLFLLLYSSVRLGTGLSELAQQPLTVNAFDLTHLLPFGDLSLRHSLTLVGLILVLIVPLGRPTQMIDYLVIAELSLGSLLSLILPLRGVRLQIGRAKRLVLNHLSDQFFQVQANLINDQSLDHTELEQLSKKAQELEQLRRMVLATPIWPFRNMAATIRAVLTATSPVIYFMVTELVRTYLLPIFTGS